MTRGFLRFMRGNVIGLLALFIALGGTTYAATALPKNSVGTKQLKNNAVTPAKIKNGSATNAKIGANAITGAKVKNDSLTGADILESSLGKVPSATSADSATNATHASNADNATTAANANALNGYAANGLIRFAQGSNSASVALGAGNTTVTSVSITAPAAGFVEVRADYNTIGTGCPCEGWYILRDAVASTLSGNYKITRNETTSTYHSSSLSWIFPVTAGVRTFQLQGFNNVGTTVSANGGAIQATYVPFGSTGASTLGATMGASSATSAK
ncbi:MAG: hypothetical protein WB462_10190 [Solirubrobacterales bacterium]